VGEKKKTQYRYSFLCDAVKVQVCCREWTPLTDMKLLSIAQSFVAVPYLACPGRVWRNSNSLHSRYSFASILPSH
jgi:hypothetical protein